MFKLVALTALIATTSASTKADENAVKKDAANLQAKAKAMASTPGSKIFAKDKKTTKYLYMADTTPDFIEPIAAKTKISSLSTDCFSCIVTGNVYTAAKTGTGAHAAECNPPTNTDHITAASDAALDYTLEYKDFITGIATCPQGPACEA